MYDSKVQTSLLMLKVSGSWLIFKVSGSRGFSVEDITLCLVIVRSQGIKDTEGMFRCLLPLHFSLMSLLMFVNMARVYHV